MYTVLTLVAVVGVSYLLMRVYGIRSTLRNLQNALMELQGEVDAANHIRERRYRSVMYRTDLLEDEKHTTTRKCAEWHEALATLESAPLRDKFGKAWKQRCDLIAVRAHERAEDLQSEAFWAQFPPGSRAAESRHGNGVESE